MLTRCTWCSNDPLYVDYHDTEWGVPVRDERTLFEFLILEGAQAGLSWITVLRKRAGYRRAFLQFDAEKIAGLDDQSLDQLLLNPNIIRNRRKVYSARANAQAFLKVQHTHGSFAAYLWNFVDNQPRQNHWPSAAQVPATSPVSDQLSKDMRQRGFSFAGSTIMYAYMQAVGLVNDHTVDCFRHRDCQHVAATTQTVSQLIT